MKGFKMSLTGIFFCISLISFAQIPEPDKSPMDISYAPANYPILKFQGKTKLAQPLARVIYSRPQQNGRALFGKEIKYHEIWRMGANESTEIEFFSNVQIGGKRIAKGRYTLFCIPEPARWTIVINKHNDTWGAFSYKSDNDVARATIPIKKRPELQVEYLTMYFNEKNNLLIMWGDIAVELPILMGVK